MVSPSAQAEEAEDGHDDHDKSDKIDDAIHLVLPPIDAIWQINQIDADFVPSAEANSAKDAGRKLCAPAPLRNIASPRTIRRR
jgi:hypothetical protein